MSNDRKKGPPDYKLEVCTRDKSERVYADLGALWLGDERPFAMFAGAYKERLYITHVTLSNGQTVPTDRLFLNINAPKPRKDDGEIPF